MKTLDLVARFLSKAFMWAVQELCIRLLRREVRRMKGVFSEWCYSFISRKISGHYDTIKVLSIDKIKVNI